MAQQVTSLPWHLRGPYAPVLEEQTLTNLEVIGELPRDLRGTSLRNGPNPRSGMSPAWFAGEGMLHGMRIEGGRAVWYRNRWIAGRTAPNTNVVEHAGRIFALVETSIPVEVTPELETLGQFSFDDGTIPSVFAHPKKHPGTGELLFLSYQRAAPHLTFYRADARGSIVHRAPIHVPAMTLMHDMAITERYAIFWDLPVLVGDWRTSQPIRWAEDYRARIGVVPHDGQNGDVRWFDVKPAMVIHTMNAFEEGDSVVLDVIRAPRLMGQNQLYRYRFDLRTGDVAEAVIDPRFIDMPRVHPSVEGKPYRYGYALELGEWIGGGFHSTTLRKFDMATGHSVVHDFGPQRMAGECIVVPRPGAKAEDDAWAMLFVYDKNRDASDFVVLDAQRFDQDPIATVRLPHRVPFGLHGNWIPAGTAPG